MYQSISTGEGGRCSRAAYRRHAPPHRGGLDKADREYSLELLNEARPHRTRRKLNPGAMVTVATGQILLIFDSKRYAIRATWVALTDRGVLTVFFFSSPIRTHTFRSPAETSRRTTRISIWAMYSIQKSNHDRLLGSGGERGGEAGGTRPDRTNRYPPVSESFPFPLIHLCDPETPNSRSTIVNHDE